MNGPRTVALTPRDWDRVMGQLQNKPLLTAKIKKYCGNITSPENHRLVHIPLTASQYRIFKRVSKQALDLTS